jgi:hypothetical protein
MRFTQSSRPRAYNGDPLLKADLLDRGSVEVRTFFPNYSEWHHADASVEGGSVRNVVDF